MKNRFPITHMSHAVRTVASRFQQLFHMFFHVCLHATHCPTLACVALVFTWGRQSHPSERTRRWVTVANKRENAAHPFAASAALRLCGGLEDRAEPTSLHCVDGFDGVKVFDEQRARGLLLVGVGDLKGVCQGSQSLDRVVVRFSNLLSLVCVHRFENHAKGCVGCFVFVYCSLP